MVLTATAGLLTPLLIFVGIRDFSTRQQLFDVSRSDPQAQQSPYVNGRLVETALQVRRPPHATGILVRGSDDLLATSWDFGPDGTQGDSSQNGTARTARTGVSLDLEFLIRVVLGLLAVSLAADSLASERQSGTLYVLMSQPVRRWEILGSKLIGGVTVLGLALLLVITGAVAAIGMFAPALWSALPDGTLPCLYVAAMVYLFALYALGLCVGGLSSSVAAANTWSISVWMVVALASVPTLDFALKTFLPTPAVGVTEAIRLGEFETRLRKTETGLGTLLRQLVGQPRQWTGNEVTDAIRPQLTEAWTASATMTRQALTALDNQTAALAERQHGWQRRVSFASPANLFFETASRLAGTGQPTAARWEHATHAHQTFLNDALFDNPPQLTLRVPTIEQGLAIMPVELRPLPTAADLERFIPPTETFAMRVRDACAPLAALTGWAVLLAVAAFVAFAKTRY